MIRVPVKGRGYIHALKIDWGFNMYDGENPIPVIIATTESGSTVRVEIDETNAYLFPCEYKDKTSFTVGKHHQNEVWNGKEFVKKTEDNCKDH